VFAVVFAFRLAVRLAGVLFLLVTARLIRFAWIGVAAVLRMCEERIVKWIRFG
jgi:hypothetical protein